ncbi:hypothetical protein [Paraburkholderia youngii]|uniref:hypothetical protein n=1 Tax=Paraburkholderia youngii TaxID=2782701 RepID=UPI003D1ECCE5
MRMKPSRHSLALACSIGVLVMLYLCSVAAPAELDVLRWRFGDHRFALTRDLVGGLAAPRAAFACAMTSAGALGALFLSFAQQARTSVSRRT